MGNLFTVQTDLPDTRRQTIGHRRSHAKNEALWLVTEYLMGDPTAVFLTVFETVEFGIFVPHLIENGGRIQLAIDIPIPVTNDEDNDQLFSSLASLTRDEFVLGLLPHMHMSCLFLKNSQDFFLPTHFPGAQTWMQTALAIRKRLHGQRSELVAGCRDESGGRPWQKCSASACLQILRDVLPCTPVAAIVLDYARAGCRFCQGPMDKKQCMKDAIWVTNKKEMKWEISDALPGSDYATTVCAACRVFPINMSPSLSITETRRIQEDTLIVTCTYRFSKERSHSVEIRKKFSSEQVQHDVFWISRDSAIHSSDICKQDASDA